MDLIDGVTLGEHVASLKEKKEKFSESQIWKIFMQVIFNLANEQFHNGNYILRMLQSDRILLAVP